MEISRKQFLKTAGVAAGASLWPRLPLTHEAEVKNQEFVASKSPTRITVKKVELQLKHAWTLSRNTATVKNNVFVRIEREGVAGWGEAGPNVQVSEIRGQKSETTWQVIDAGHL